MTRDPRSSMSKRVAKAVLKLRMKGPLRETRIES